MRVARRAGPEPLGTGPDRDGFALVLVLVALALLTAVASAAMASARGQLRAAVEAGGAVAGDAAARAGVEVALVRSRGAPPSSVGDSAVMLLDAPIGSGGSQRVRDLRLSPEFHLLVAAATVDRGLPRRAARVTWWMDPATRIAAHRAVVESGSLGVPPGAVVTGDSVLADRPGAVGCATIVELANAFGIGPLPGGGGLPGPPEWGAGQAGTDHARVRLGWFGSTRLRALSSHRIPTGGTAPREACPACWSGVVYGEGDVQVAAPGAGVLVADGSVDLLPGASWSGLILAAGDVQVRAGAEVLGLVRAGGVVDLEPNAAVRGSACTAYHSLAAADSLARAIALPGRSWLGPLSPAAR